MSVTTAQKVYEKFRADDNILDNYEDFTDLYLHGGSSFKTDDGRTLSNISDFSEIPFGNPPTMMQGIDEKRPFSNMSNFSDRTFDNLISDTSATILMDKAEDGLHKSSVPISDDHVNSMDASSCHMASTLPFFPTKVR